MDGQSRLLNSMESKEDSQPEPLLQETLEGWAARWEKGAIGWHKNFVDPFLLDNFKSVEEHLGRAGGGGGGRRIRTLVPLCGKTHDLLWLGSEGRSSVGVEFTEQAVLEFFADHQLSFSKEPVGSLVRYKSTSEEADVEIYQGDFFACSSELLGQFDAVWDTASMVAINVLDRQRYADLIQSLLKPKAAILMVTLVYDQSQRDRHPYSVPLDLVKQLFGKCSVQLLHRMDMLKYDEKFKRFNIDPLSGLIMLLAIASTV